MADDGGAWGQVVEIGGNKFEVSAELAEALKSQEQGRAAELQKALDTNRADMQRLMQEELRKVQGAPRDEGGEKVDDVSGKFWENPVDIVRDMIKQQVDGVREELTSGYKADSQAQKAMSRFWEDNPELRNHEELVDFIATRHGDALRGIQDTQERMNELAKLASSFILEVRGGKSEGEGPATEAGGTVKRGMANGDEGEVKDDVEVPGSLSDALKMSRKQRSGIAESLGL